MEGGIGGRLDGGEEVEDIGIGFARDEFFDLDGAREADFAEVIAHEVDDHEEFSFFFF